MKTTHALAIVLSLAAITAHAQSVTGTATSANTVQSTSAAQNAGNSQGITFNSEAANRVHTTPSVGLGSFAGSFSSDYCRGTAQVGGAATGGLISFGGPVTDDNCVLYRGIERTMQVSSTIRSFNPTTSARMDQAAIDMLCSVPQLAPAMRVQGLCTLPDNTTQRATVQQASIYSGGQ